MKAFETTSYTIKDLYDSYKRKELVLSPKFQRRPVWEYKAKSYLIDTLLRGLPVPLVFIREEVLDRTKDYRQQKEVVDGQQRLRAIFDFIDDGFSVSGSHNRNYGGKKFSDLPEDVALSIFQYSLSVIRLVGKTDNEISDIFARLNTYSIVLNTQELLHSQFFGEYKQVVDLLSSRYREAFVTNKIITEKRVARMADKKLITDILDPIVTGRIRSINKNNLTEVYKEYDDSFESADMVVDRVSSMIDLLLKTYGDVLPETAFRRNPVFSSTIIAMYRINWTLGAFDSNECKPRLDECKIPQLRTALDEVSRIAESDEDSYADKEVASFAEAISRQTTNPEKIKIRTDFIENSILRYL